MTAFAEHKTHPGLPGLRAPEGVEGGTGDGIAGASNAKIARSSTEQLAAMDQIFARCPVEKFDSLRQYQVIGCPLDRFPLINNEVSRKNVRGALYSGDGLYQVHVTFPKPHHHRWLVGYFGEMLPEKKMVDVAAGETVQAVRDEGLGQLIAIIKELKEAGVTCNVKVYGLPRYNIDRYAGLRPAPEPLPDWWTGRHDKWAEANRNAVRAMFKEAHIEIEARWGSPFN